MNTKNKLIIEEIGNKIVESKNILVIVEGKRDNQALQKLGFKHIVILNKPLFAVVDDIVHMNVEKVLILTDLDFEGKRLYSILKKDFNSKGIVVDDTLRHLLFKTDLRHIEGLDSFLANHSS